jgi:hypothetical protein
VRPVAAVRSVTRPTSATEIGGRIRPLRALGCPVLVMVQLHYYLSPIRGVGPGAGLGSGVTDREKERLA